MYRVYIVRKKCLISVWPIMNHYIATGAVLFQDAVLCSISATFGLPPPLANTSPSYLFWSTRLASQVTRFLRDCFMWGPGEGQRLLTKSTGWRRTYATNWGVR
jgi:hypothetical protein